MKIVRTDCELEVPLVDAALRDAGHQVVLLPDGVTEDRLCAEAAGADLILMCYTPITRRVIEAAPRLKGIVKYGVGIDAIDIPAATQNGVVVVNVPEYAEETVAEGAFAHMIALAKRLPEIGAEMAAKGWTWPEEKWLGCDIAGSTVGIIGFGKIGRSMARMAGAGFRARVIAYSPHTQPDDMRAKGVEPVSDLNDLLRQSDFVSIHCVLNDDTHHLIGEAELRMMKRNAILINVSRGAVVDEQALIRALDEGWIAGAGLDVFGQEPLALSGHPLSPLFGRPNVILTPHLTFFTHEAMRRLQDDTLDRCFEVLNHAPVLIKSKDPRLQRQTQGVRFADD